MDKKGENRQINVRTETTKKKCKNEGEELPLFPKKKKTGENKRREERTMKIKEEESRREGGRKQWQSA